jgi:hypothetical protein
MANTKLMKVMEYLINEQEDKARDLLHQIFIEKARAIHEEMMQEEDDEDMHEETLGGHQGDDFVSDTRSKADKLRAYEAEIDAEQNFSSHMEGEDMDAEMAMDDAVEDLGDELEDMDADDADMDDEEVEVDMDMNDEDMTMDDDAEDAHVDDEAEHDESEEDRIEDLEAAIQALKAEFEALKHEGDDEAHESEASMHDDADEEEDKVSEAWEAMDEEEYHDLDENIDLETVTAAKGGEVGSGKFARAEGNTRSPVANTRSDMGAKAVVTGKGPKPTGFEHQTPPASHSMGANNRLKKSTQGMSPVSKEGSTKALLNKDRSEGFGAPNTTSPIKGR